jgi:hypothetical protein
MMEATMPPKPGAAEAIFPHLPRATVSTPDEPRRNTSPLAASMYPNLLPKAPPPEPRPQLSPQEVSHFWATVDESWARLVGLRKLKT